MISRLIVVVPIGRLRPRAYSAPRSSTIQELKPRYETDHLNSYLCDDPSNFFLLYGPLNRAFGFERLMGYKKKLAGDAWDGVVHFVKKAIEIEYGLYGSR